MAEILFESGIIEDDIYAVTKEGKKIKTGVAIYDLEDSKVRISLIKMKDDIKSIENKYTSLINNAESDKSNDDDGFPNNIKTISNLYLDFTNELIEVVDNVFGEGFSQRAIDDSKNPTFLIGVIAEIIFNYEGVSDDRFAKYTNRAQRRAGIKAGEKT